MITYYAFCPLGTADKIELILLVEMKGKIKFGFDT
jgi:hypothetical protein